MSYRPVLPRHLFLPLVVLALFLTYSGLRPATASAMADNPARNTTFSADPAPSAPPTTDSDALAADEPPDYGPSGWSRFGGEWEHGTPTVVGPAICASGDGCWGTDLDNTYNGVTHDLTSDSIRTPSAGGGTIRLRYQRWLNVTHTTTVATQCVPAGGFTTRETMPLTTGGLWLSSGVIDTGCPAGNTIRIRFRLAGTGTPTTPGAYIDDVELLDSTGTTVFYSENFNTPAVLAAPGVATRSAPACAANTIQGTVFRDFDANGRRNVLEPFLVAPFSATVTAYNAAGTAIATTTTNTSGAYSLSVPNGTAVRVELTGLPAGFQYSAVDTTGASPSTNWVNRSEVVFVTSPTCTVDFSIQRAAQYCQAAPVLSTSMYAEGNQQTAGVPVLVSFPYTAYGIPPQHTFLVNSNLIGTTWGMAYQRQSNDIFVASFMKRHSGFGPNAAGTATTTGAIYRVDRDNANAVTVFSDRGASTGADPHPAPAATCTSAAQAGTTNANCWLHDANSWDAVGKIGYGDLDIGEDDNTLWAVNLNTRALEQFSISGGSFVNSFAIPTTACTTASDARPFGLAVQDGLIYVGMVCSGQTTATDLNAHVYTFNGATFSASPILSVPLNYPRGCVVKNPGNCTAGERATWRPWAATFSAVLSTVTNEYLYPQPMLSDIVFDNNGDMLLALRDRFGDQTGMSQGNTNNTIATLYIGDTGGDTLRACRTGPSAWTLESNGTCGSVTTGGAGNNEGPGGGEYFSQDNYPYHDELPVGGLAQIPGRAEFASTVFDAINTATIAFAGGIYWQENATGLRISEYQIYGDSRTASPNTFGKANGLGDLEAFCTSAPIEIGNRIWDDADNDGVQDAGENPVSGITVLLFQGVTQVGSTTTNANGQYIFNTSNVTGGLLASTAYQIRVDRTQAGIGSRPLSPTDTNSGANSDLRDSDATLSGNNAIINVTTGAAGANNHSLDIGFFIGQDIGDFVWLDLDADGIQDAGEPGIPGVVVNLYDGTNAFIGSTVTNASGGYLFTVPIGNYFVEFVPPPGYAFTLRDQGGNDALDSDPDRTTGRTITFTVNPGVDDMTWDAGMYRPAALGNYVWLDEDSDGYQDAGEPGLPNVTVELLDATGTTVLATTTTDAEGGYLFPNLAPGSYQVRVAPASLPAGLTQTTVNPVGAGVDYGNQTQPYSVTLAGGGENLTADFGYNWNPTGSTNPPVPGTIPDPTAALGDRIWVDVDGDGVQDPDEPGVSGVALTLTCAGADGIFGNGDDTTAATTTNATGNYIFNGLTPGACTVTVNASNFNPGGALFGYAQTGDPDHFGSATGTNDNTTTTPVLLAPGDVFLNADFGYQPGAGTTGSIGDFVWFDTDGDGAQDAGEPGIPGVTVTLIRDSNGNGVWDAGEPILATDTTNANGGYLFAGLPLDDGDGDADYLVWVNDTNNVLAPLTQSFDADGIATPNISATFISSGTPNRLTQDFGYTPIGHGPTDGLIGDTIYLDLDGDGTQDANEPGMEGIQVTVTNTTTGATYVVFTDENGHYYVGNLPAGTYTVTVTPPAGYTNTGDPDGGGNNTSTVTIGAGGINLNQDFGYNATGTIGNFIWRDSNADGDFDGANGPDGIPGNDDDEPAITGVTVELYRDLDRDGRLDPGEPLIATQTTNGSTGANYLFTGLSVNDGSGSAAYIVNVSDAAGVLTGMWHSLGTAGTNNNSQADPYAVTLSTGSPNNLTADFGYYRQPGAVGNRLWYDSDGDNLQDVGEPGITGIQVTLTSVYPNGTTTTLVTTTNADGYYSFGNLLLDENYDGAGAPAVEPVYTISVNLAQPALAAYSPITPDVGGDDRVDGDPYAGVTAVATEGLVTIPLTVGAAASEPTPRATYDFGFVSSQEIGNFVWRDLDADGIQDVGEPGIPGVVVNLYDGTSAFIGSTVTNGTGHYTFTVAIGNYFLEFVPPPGYVFSPRDQGGDDNVDSDPNRTTGRTATFTVLATVDDYSWDAGLYLPAALGNYVWLDENSDGYQDPGEPGLPNVRVELLNAAGTIVLASTTTDAQGGYLFPNLAPGTYQVRVDTASLPAGLTQTSVFPVPAGTDYGNQPQPYSITLAGGGENLTADFGYNWNPTTSVDPSPPTTIPDPTAALGDRIWVDVDGDGAQDPDEPGISGVSLTLTCVGADGILGTGDDVTATTTTNATGNYIFNGLTPDTCRVTVDASNFNAGQPLFGFTQTGDPDHFGTTGTNDNTTTTLIPLGPGDVFLNADFGYQPGAGTTGSIGDFVWFDSDGDGVQDAGEPGITGVTVTLIRDTNGNGTWDPGEPILATDTTNAGGAYLFAGLPLNDGDGDADYLVWVNDTHQVLTGLTQSFDADGTATPNISATAISAGTPNVLTQDFGYTPAGQGPTDGLIGDTIYLDMDNDGTQDANEPGMEGIQVTVVNTTTGATYIVFTDENGHYYVGNLPAGTYTVTVTPPAGFTNTGDPDGGNDSTSTVTIGVGGINLNQDFGYNAPGSIGNFVWRDTNADGDYDGPNGPDGIPANDDDEPAIAGVTVELYRDLDRDGLLDPGEPLAGTLTTDAAGGYLFSGLSINDGSGTAAYIVNVSDAANVLAGTWHSLGTAGTNNNSQSDPYAVSLSLGSPNNLTADFGYYYLLPASVGNRVWSDDDSDGIQDAGEMGISGVLVTLTTTYPNGTTTTLVTTTNLEGYYSFNALLLDENHNGTGGAGSEPTYTLSVNTGQPNLTGYTPTTINVGADDRVDSDNHAGVTAVTTEGLVTIPMTTGPAAGEPNPRATYDFGFVSALDYGDLPTTYTITKLGNDGARHTVGSLFMGPTIDADGDGQPNFTATGDDGDGQDDENGVIRTPGSIWSVGAAPTNGGALDVFVTGGSGFVSAWIDWTQDGDFDDAGEAIFLNQAVTAGNNTVRFDIPPSATFTGDYNLRVRLNGTGGLNSPVGFGGVGEVEDYQLPAAPLAVTLATFEAIYQAGSVLVAWETTTEVNNVGFNLWRGSDASDPTEQLNSEGLIPSQGPGSSQGFAYEWLDENVEAGATYYYWLEDVDTHGTITRHGPVSITVSAPTAVTLGTLGSQSASTPLLPLLALGLLGVGALGLLRRYAIRAKGGY